MELILNKNTRIITEISTKPILNAIHSFERDIEKSCIHTEKKGTSIFLKKENLKQECFRIQMAEAGLLIEAADDLGFIYGIYYVSRNILGIHDFWFWNDQKIIQKEGYAIRKDFFYQSNPFATRFRGWFVNDEVLLHTWSLDRQKDKPWEMVFEALLRCGGNMVIPGTDRNSEHYRIMASKMGLFITHHHAEPLGAEMFARAYPKSTPSYEEHPDKFKQLWEDGIAEQKNMKVIWNLGFRGQGDCPFWEDDPRYQTQRSRGELMSRLIKIQYDMVKQSDTEAVCCTNLYGETMELYQEGLLDLPEDVIKIWADNGFGKMVTRRQGNHNPRIPALPSKKDKGKHGIYYHVSFYDLQAANHMTMLSNTPEFVQKELYEVLNREIKDYWIINCSNIKPHVYFLDYIAQIWRDGSIDIAEHRETYIENYYGRENEKEIEECLKDYPKYALAYGKHEDEHAGEQFSNHVARVLISQYMRNESVPTKELLWATDVKSLKEQVLWYRTLCAEACRNYELYLEECKRINVSLSEPTRTLFEDSLLLQAYLHYYCYSGAYDSCECLLKAMEEDYQKAFYFAGKARNKYLAANQAMRDREHGKWHNFYANECLTDMKQTAWVLEGLMSYLRNMGDGPHFYQWQRDFLYSEEDRRVMLILNMENHLTDKKLFELMEEKWGN